jgi:hypothetical protein
MDSTLPHFEGLTGTLIGPLMDARLCPLKSPISSRASLPAREPASAPPDLLPD